MGGVEIRLGWDSLDSVFTGEREYCMEGFFHKKWPQFTDTKAMLRNIIFNFGFLIF